MKSAPRSHRETTLKVSNIGCFHDGWLAFIIFSPSPPHSPGGPGRRGEGHTHFAVRIFALLRDSSSTGAPLPVHSPMPPAYTNNFSFGRPRLSRRKMAAYSLSSHFPPAQYTTICSAFWQTGATAAI